MRRPIRTRRLSIDAILSFAAFLVVAIAGIRSFSVWNAWGFGNGGVIGVEGGCILYTYTKPILQPFFRGPLDGRMHPGEFDFPQSHLGFAVTQDLFHNVSPGTFGLRVPLWPLLVLLLIIPARWLIARSANTPGFQVIAKQP